ncbi:MAG: hypothetical protein MUF51_11195, partial [Vicinamibacteria bacterium]|nr:hypothetical protein [Vicinamibacteria bacterium]
MRKLPKDVARAVREQARRERLGLSKVVRRLPEEGMRVSSLDRKRQWPLRVTLLVAVTSITLGLPALAPSRAAAQERRTLDRTELAEAMRTHGNYNLAATTNGPRFQSEIFFTLARRALATQPRGGRIFIRHQDWFEVFLDVAKLAPQQAPLPSRLVNENGQDIELDFRPGHIVKGIGGGRQVKAALNVKFWWETSA